MKKFIDDLLRDYKTEKWSLGRVSFALLFLIILASVLLSVIRTGQIPDIPNGMLYLIALLLGYNATTKFVLKNFITPKGDDNGGSSK